MPGSSVGSSGSGSVLEGSDRGADSLSPGAVGTFFDIGAGGALPEVSPAPPRAAAEGGGGGAGGGGAASSPPRPTPSTPLGGCPGLEAELAAGSSGSGRVLHRRATQALLERAERAGGAPSPSASPPPPAAAVLLAGARGAGKSVALAALVAWARLRGGADGWITLWCPSPRGAALLGAGGGTYSWNEAARGWDTPRAAAAVAGALLASHAGALATVAAPAEDELRASLCRSSPASPPSDPASYPVSPALLSAKTLREVAEIAAGLAGGGSGGKGGGKRAEAEAAGGGGGGDGASSSSSLETDAAVVLLSALRSPTCPLPFLVAIDDAHSLISPGAPSNLWERRRNQGRERIPAAELRVVRELVRPFLAPEDSPAAGRSRGLEVAAVAAEGSWSSSSRRGRRQRQLSAGGTGGAEAAKPRRPEVFVVPRFDRNEWDLLMQAWQEAGVRGRPPPAGAAAARAAEAAAAAAAAAVAASSRGGSSAALSRASFAVAAAGEAAAASAAFIVAGGAPGKARAMHAALL